MPGKYPGAMVRSITILLICIGSNNAAVGQSEGGLAIPQEWNSELLNYRNTLVTDDAKSLKELRGLLIRWDSIGASKAEQVDFTFNVLKARVIDGWSYKYIKKKALEYQPGVLADTFTENDLRIMASNSDLLDLIFLGVLEWEFPFTIKPETEFYRELASYEIEGSERIGEVGAGTGVFSLMLKLFHPDVALFVNELDRAFVKYIAIKLTRGVGDLVENKLAAVKGSRRSTNLEGYELDKIIIRNTLHHFKDQGEMLESITASLRPGGELFVLEAIQELDLDGDICEYALTRATLKEIFVENGFELLKEVDFSEAVLFKLRKI